MDKHFPLLPAQQNLVYHALLNDKYTEVYAVQHAIELNTAINPQRLQKACQYAIDRNEILRGHIVIDDNNSLKLKLKKYIKVDIEEIDIRSQKIDKQTIVRKLIDSDRKKGFDIFKSPLFRFTLIQTSANNFYFLWTFHHILLGADSMYIMQELLQVYQNLTDSLEHKEPALRSYQEFITNFHKNDFKKSEIYWKALLKNYINDRSLKHTLL